MENHRQAGFITEASLLERLWQVLLSASSVITLCLSEASLELSNSYAKPLLGSLYLDRDKPTFVIMAINVHLWTTPSFLTYVTV